MQEIYLDNAATAKPLPEAVEAFNAALREYGNPSSLHGAGIRAKGVSGQTEVRFGYAFIFLDRCSVGHFIV